MSVKYFDICDTAFKRDMSTGDLFVLRSTSDGKVYEDEPSETEFEKFSRNCGVIFFAENSHCFIIFSNI